MRMKYRIEKKSQLGLNKLIRELLWYYCYQNALLKVFSSPDSDKDIKTAIVVFNVH